MERRWRGIRGEEGTESYWERKGDQMDVTVKSEGERERTDVRGRMDGKDFQTGERGRREGEEIKERMG